MEKTLERIAKCRYKTKMDKRSGVWQIDLTAAAQEVLAFITPEGRVSKRTVMPFGVANAPALFQELMSKILYILAHANCTLCCAPNAQKRTGSQQGKRTIFLDV